ncbi:Octaprenyl diphosphate synthase [hydrothermal vent metagenome]|uniref:Octaprenyl diphosphate synthase n=1 Tax=hydrothermal vent metagenome TaxID=652676 RepID=A0A3B0ZZ52_9ZZZZ
MNIDSIYTLISDDMKQVNATILKRLQSEIVLINQVGTHIINSGGKRLRPVIHLLCARAIGYSGVQHIDIAAIIEFIHTATLLHDDVVDASDLRRGQETANSLWGNEASVLVGDFLYSRAFQMMVDVGDMQIMSILANATNTIAEGEVQQLLNVHDPETTEQRYLDVIHNKTAKLFESASELAAILGQQDSEAQKAMAKYGMHLGTAFQLIDDVLDYSASSEEMGKNIGDDLAEGKPTLPLIYTIQNGTKEQADMVRKAIEENGLDYIDAVTEAIQATGAIDYTADCAKKESQLAIAALENVANSEYKTALIDLAKFAVHRKF